MTNISTEERVIEATRDEAKRRVIVDGSRGAVMLAIEDPEYPHTEVASLTAEEAREVVRALEEAAAEVERAA